MKRRIGPSDVRPDARRDVGEELRFHLDMRTQEFIDAGMNPEDARRAAAAAFGDVAAIGAELRSARTRRERARERHDRLQELVMDVRFAARTLRTNVAFTAASLLTLALGIGATTAVFTVVNGVLLRPLPYADPSRLEMIWLSSKRDGLGSELPLSAGFFSDARSQTKSFSAMAAFRSWSYTLTTDGDPEQLSGVRTTPSLFSVLGVRPLLGRAIADADAQPGASKVAIVSYALWQRRFGGSASVVGRRVDLGGDPFTIIGVMPPDFAFPRGAELPPGLQFAMRTELWTPLVFEPRELELRNYGTLNLAAIGRLRPGVTASAARSELSAHFRAWRNANARTLDLDYRLLDLQQQASKQVRRALLFLMGAVAFVLFIACANVTNLLVARTAGRRREFAVRAALGAGRARIARQLVTENLLLAAGGTILGVALSIWATRAMLALVPGSLPRLDDVRIDWRVTLTAGLIAAAVGGAFGLVSTIQVRWRALAGVLHDSGVRSTGGAARSAGRRALVVAEVSLSLMLIIGAGLLAASFGRLQRVSPGFDPKGTLTAGVSLPIANGFNPARDGPTWARFFGELTDRLARSPGVRSVGAVSTLPLSGGVEGGAMAIVGQPKPEAGQAPHAEYAVVEGDYFRTMAITLLGGRVFSRVDGASSPRVMIVNREFARKYFAGRSAVGQQIICYFDFYDTTARTVVGVVGDVRQTALDAPPQPQVYVPQQQMPYPSLRVVIRTDADPMTAVPMLRREVAALDRRLAVADVHTIQDVFDESLARQRFSVTIIGCFAGSALLLAMIGLYGVIALGVGQRRREIGVRMALGARPSDVLRLVLGEGARITTAGVALGLLGAVAISRLMTSMLYGVSATSVPVYLTATVAIVAVTFVATFLPARKATRVDPTTALRAE
jgi:putative ABC transport system permease protein